MKRIVLLGLCLAAIWSSLWVVRPNASLPPPTSTRALEKLPGKPPLDLGGVFLCTLDVPYRAYARRAHHFYPPNHPLLPSPAERPDRCFGTEAEAEAAGYSVALGPSGSLEVDGIYLLPEWYFHREGFGSACLRAARRLGFAVPCPLHLPNTGFGQDPPRCGAPSALLPLPTRPPCVVGDSVFLFEEAGFAAPPGYSRGGLAGGTHLVIAAYRAGRGVIEGGFEPYYANFILCTGARSLQGVPLDRYLDGAPPVRGELLLCGRGNPLSGYLILRWHERTVVYTVAVQGGDTRVNRDLAQAVAARIRLVEAVPRTPGP